MLKMRTKTEVSITVDNTRAGFMALLGKWNSLEDSDKWELVHLNLKYDSEHDRCLLEVDLQRESNT